ncbi:S4 domain-containing protein, partial [Mesorhizobium prunaredense]|uniref:S4 domain-containing protein n=1 Tax=Mesorhizobium prunaredense TaxID=1631249 RepID=UPI0024533D14
MSAHNEETPILIEDGLMEGGSPDGGSPNGGSVVLEAGPDAAGQRLDQWLAGKLGPDMSRSRVQMLIRQGAVKVGGQPVNETKRKMAAGDRVSVDMPEPEPAEP